LSRAIENITRDADAWIASVAEKIAIATVIKSVLPNQLSSWLVMTHATPSVDSIGSSSDGADVSAARIISPPPTNDSSSALMIALGAPLFSGALR